MVRGRCKSREDWLKKRIDGISLDRVFKLVEGDPYNVNCLLCNKLVSVHNQGSHALQQHHEGKTHKRRFRSRFFAVGVQEMMPEQPENETPDLNAAIDNTVAVDVNDPDPQPSCSGVTSHSARARKRTIQRERCMSDSDPDDPPPGDHDDEERPLEQVRVIEVTPTHAGAAPTPTQEEANNDSNNNNNPPGII